MTLDPEKIKIDGSKGRRSKYICRPYAGLYREEVIRGVG